MTKSPFELGGRRYCILPARICYDRKLRITTLRVLMAICIHTNGHGIAWMSRTTLGHIVGRTPTTISRHTRRLIEHGYIRKLKSKPYSIPRKSKHHWSTSRWQILFEGRKTKLPSQEEFAAPRPRIRSDVATIPDIESDQGVRGINSQYRAIAQSYVAGVAETTGEPKIAENQYEIAKKLELAGIKPEQVREYTRQCSIEYRSAGKPAPASLKIVAHWAGLD